MKLFHFVMIPILCSLFIYILPFKKRKYFTVAVQIFILSAVIYKLFDGYILITESISMHSIDIGMKLRWDYLSKIMLTLNSTLFLLATIYGFNKSHLDRLFLFLFLALQGIINGIFLSADFFNIYLLVEAASIVVSILIMYKKDAQSIYDGMLYLMVNLVAMVFFLFGVGYMYKIFGSFDILYIAEKIYLVENKSILAMPFAFLLTGISLKSALMPLFSWLPKAHATPSAPTPVSAILSGVFVKTGVYMLIRLYSIFNAAFDLSELFFVLGIVTAILGAIFAFSQKDIKLILSYHTVSQVGLIVTAVSVNSNYASLGAYYHIYAHGIFKALLILTASSIARMYHTRDVSEIKGLWKNSKFLSVGLLIGMVSITGLPYTSGGFSKYMIAKGFNSNFLHITFIIMSMVTMMSFSKFFKLLFSSPNSKVTNNTSVNEKISIGMLSLLSIFIGVFGNRILNVFTGYYYPYHVTFTKYEVYIIEFIGAYIIYRSLSNLKIIKKIRNLELNFNQIVLSMTIFFMLVMVYYNITTV